MASSDRDPKNKQLRNALDDEDDFMKTSVDKVLDDQSKSYFEQAKNRDPRVGVPRIGTSFTLREDFYSAMWLYYFKTDYLLGTDPNKIVGNMNMPDVDIMTDTKKKDEVITEQLLLNPSPLASPSRNIIQPSDNDFSAPDKEEED